MNENKQIEALAATIHTHLRSDSMSRALASLLYEEGWRKDEKLLINEGKSNNSEFISNNEIEEMAKCCTYYHKGGCCADATDICKCDLMCEMFGVFANLEAAGYRKQEWISVEERLPEVGEDVLLYSKEDDKIDIGHYSNMFCRFFLRKFEDGNVTHWMPLPQPPKGE